MPRSPRSTVNLSKLGHGAMFKGDKGFIIAGFKDRILIPYGDSADMSYYTRRAKEDMLPNIGHFQKEWTDACKGNLKTSCDFDYAGKMIEMMMLGLVSYRVGEKLQYDGKAGQITNVAAAAQDPLYKRQYRDGWPLNG